MNVVFILIFVILLIFCMVPSNRIMLCVALSIHFPSVELPPDMHKLCLRSLLSLPSSLSVCIYLMGSSCVDIVCHDKR